MVKLNKRNTIYLKRNAAVTGKESCKCYEIRVQYAVIGRCHVMQNSEKSIIEEKIQKYKSKTKLHKNKIRKKKTILEI